MKTLFDGLLLYEITLLLLGVILFIILSIGLMYYIIKKEQLKKLLGFFILPIIMIGYPSIKEISISKDRIALTRYQQQYIENPQDSVAKQKVEEITEKLERRASEPKDILQISKSNLLLGNNTKAVNLAEKATEKSTSGSEVEAEAQDIKSLATVQKRLEANPEERMNVLKQDSLIQDVKVSEGLNNLKPFMIKKFNQLGQ